MTEKELLRELKIWPNFNGYQYLMKGFELIRDNPDYLQGVTKCLYPDIAKDYKISWSGVERAIRISLDLCWYKGNREFLDVMAGYHLKKRPTVSEFFAISWLYLYQNEDESEE